MSENEFIYKKNFLTGIDPDQTVVYRKSLLASLPGIKKWEAPDILPDTVKSAIDEYSEWYPYVNSYYPFTEDVDAFARVHHLLEAKRGCDSIEHLKLHKSVNEYDQKRALYQYLRSNPMCFLILGKPGLGEEEVGKRLADYWKCVYIDPLLLLEEEIAKDSRPGQCIEFNLRCGRAIGIDVLTRLLVKKVQSPEVLHRGFVCCGFPLIPNDLYEEDPISSESAVFNVREIFDEIIDQTLRQGSLSGKVAVSLVSSSRESDIKGADTDVSIERLDESAIKLSIADWSMESQICGPPEISTDLERQLNCIIGLFHDPFIVIYLHARNSDVVAKRDNYYFDIYSGQSIDMQKVNLFYEIGASDDNLTDDLFGAGRNPFAENPTLRHIVKVPENMPANVNTQLDRYHNNLVNILDTYILQHDHQYYIKLDGRSFITKMLEQIKLRLKVLPLQQVLIPERFVKQDEIVGEDDKPPEIDQITPEEAFVQFSRQETPAPFLKWTWSSWGTYCPVSMFHRNYQNGSPRFAVHFANQIFFLANLQNYQRFVENPRRYLLPPFPKPGQYIFVFGPPVSGKSAVSKCLGYLLNCKVLTANEICEEYFNEAFEEYKENVKQGAIAEAMEILKDNYFQEMQELHEKTMKWEAEVLEGLKTLHSIFASQEPEISSFPLKLEPDLEVEQSSIKEEASIRKRLASLNFPRDVTPEMCKSYIDEPLLIQKHYPTDLKVEKKPPSVLDPFVLNYANDKVANIDLTEVKEKAKENIFDMYIQGIRSIDHQAQYDGCIIDGMTTDVSLLQRISEEFPIHDVVILTNVDKSFLTNRFKEGNKIVTRFHDFRNFFLGLREIDAAARAPSTESTQSYKKEIASEVVNSIFNTLFDEEEIKEEDEESCLRYEENLYTYDKEIAEVASFFEEMDLRPIVVEVDDLKIQDLMKAVINKLKDSYRVQATEFTDADRAEEIQQFLTQAGPVGVEGEGAPPVADDFLAKYRQYGDTSYYCPVTFTEKFVLWRGKEEHAVKFKEKIYLCSNEKNKNKFMQLPRNYLFIFTPPERFSPPRICVIGPNEDQVSQLSKRLAKNLGVRYVNYAHYQSMAVNKFSSLSLLVGNENVDLTDSLTMSWYEMVFSALFFDEPFKYIGFVLDGFPAKRRCLVNMVEAEAVPDMIICLAMSREENLKRRLEKILDDWRKIKEKNRQDLEELNAIIRSDWEERRNARYNELMEFKRQNRYTRKISEGKIEQQEDESKLLASDTQVSFESVVEQEEHDEVMQILDDEMPEPVIEEDQENEDAVIEQNTEEILNHYDRRVGIYDEMKRIAEKELIPFVEIDGNQEFERIVRQAYILTDPIKFRGPSFFERCYEVSETVAEKLLETGYCFLSFFGRLCPVQYFDGENHSHMYIAANLKNKVYPVIHRHYVYFLYGKKSRDRFCKNPLKYITQNRFQFPLIPMRVAVIGPPKSGKTSLARRFQKDLGFHLVSRGEAVRYVLSNSLYNKLQWILEAVLRKGEELPDEMVMDCVEVASLCGEAVTHGLIFDGFPNTISEMNYLQRLGLVPHLIFDLQILEEDLYKQAQNLGERTPHYSKRFFTYLLKQWQKSQRQFREWCDREYQNIYKLKVDRSIWGVWEHALEVTLAVTFERKHYFKNVKKDWPLRLANMLVTPLEFLERQSSYKAYCLGCLYYERKLNNGGDPPDRTGLIHYRKYFYWLCPEHIEDFLKVPDMFLPPSNISLPYDLPVEVHLDAIPDSCVAEGYCLVCYQRSFPNRVLNKGVLRYIVLYRNQYYMFDTYECMKHFMATPDKLSSIPINLNQMDFQGSLEYGSLPVLGMLEQYVAKNIVQAVCHTNRYRPIIPGLSISQSALICVGLGLKTGNPETKYKPQFEEAFELFHKKRVDLLRWLDTMKKYLNPFVHYEEPTPPFEEEVEDDGSPYKMYSARRVPVPDERFDYLCEYFKPASKVPAFLNVVDIAGLVKGASEGQGLGNAFLSHISACDAIFHLCRAFEDDDVTHVEGEINPVRDLEIIAEELRLKDEDTLNKNLEKLERTVCRGGDKKLKPEYDTLVKIKGVLVDEKKHIRFGDWDAKDIEILNKYLFLTSKPTIYLVNLSEKDYIKKKNKWLIKIKEWVDKNDPGALIIPFSGAFEHKLAEEYQDPPLRKKFLEELNTTSALDKIIVQGYKALQLEYFFTAGPDEVKAWTIQKGTKAPQAAGKIHTDFEKGFIMAEVMKFTDFKEEGSEAACKAAGKYRQQGRNYVVEDGDIIFFKFNAGAGLKDAKKK